MADLKVFLKLNNELSGPLAKAKKDVDGFSIGTKALGEAASYAARFLGPAALAGAVVMFTKNAQKAAETAEYLKARLFAVTGSAEGMNRAYAQIREMDFASIGQNTEQLTDAFVKLRNMGIGDTAKAFKVLNGVSIVTGKSIDELTQKLATGKGLKAFGIEAKMSAEQIIEYWGAQGQYQRAMEAAANTTKGSLDQMGDEWGAFLEDIGGLSNKAVKAGADIGASIIHGVRMGMGGGTQKEKLQNAVDLAVLEESKAYALSMQSMDTYSKYGGVKEKSNVDVSMANLEAKRKAVDAATNALKAYNSEQSTAAKIEAQRAKAIKDAEKAEADSEARQKKWMAEKPAMEKGFYNLYKEKSELEAKARFDAGQEIIKMEEGFGKLHDEIEDNRAKETWENKQRLIAIAKDAKDEEIKIEKEKQAELDRIRKEEMQMQQDYLNASDSLVGSLATLGKLAVTNSRANAEEQKGILTGIAIAEAAGAAVSGISAVWKEQPNWILGIVETVAVVAAIAASCATQISAIQSASFAKGTSFAPGGMSLVGEEGPELVNLPRGSQVSTAGQTRDMMSTSSNNVTINFSGTGRETTPNDLRKLSRDLEHVFENGLIDRKKLVI
jgi:hypothetical protein